MFILGLTGSIGMGKSATARMFAGRGVPVYDADAVVHRLYRGAAVGAIAKAFPEAVVDGRVDRALLGPLVVGKPEALKRLEAIVHPMVQADELAFLDRAEAVHAPLVVVEVPLLLEVGGAGRVDAVAVVSAPADIQRTRVLERPGMDEEKLAAILARQMPDADKRRRAHFVIDTGHDFAVTQKQVDDVLRALAGRTGHAYQARRAAAAGRA